MNLGFTGIKVTKISNKSYKNWQLFIFDELVESVCVQRPALDWERVGRPSILPNLVTGTAIQLVLRKETARIIKNNNNKILVVSAPDWLGTLPLWNQVTIL